MGRATDAGAQGFDQTVLERGDARGERVIPLATQTHSKAARPALREVEPCYIARGEGCRVWDVDGNEYIDLRNGLGPISLGYRFPAVEEAVRRQLECGTVFSYAHPLEVEVAEALAECIPCAESVRFLKTGGEAMAAALRLARAFTGRDTVLTCGYHGWVNNAARAGAPAAWRRLSPAMPWDEIEAYIKKALPKAMHHQNYRMSLLWNGNHNNISSYLQQWSGEARPAGV